METIRQEDSFELYSEKHFSFKPTSLASFKKKVYIGFEDGAISSLSLSSGNKIQLEKCFRYNTEPITEMLCLENMDLSPSQILIAASSLKEPQLIVWNTMT